MLEQADLAIVVADAKRRVTYWSPAAQRLVGVAPGDVVGQPLGELFVTASSTDGRAVQEQRLWHGDAQVRRGDTTVAVWLEETPLRGLDGASDGSLVVMEAVDGRPEEALTRVLLDQANDAFFVADADGRILDVNQKACDELGHARQDLIGMRLAQLEACKDDAWTARLDAAKRHGGQMLVEVSLQRQDGSSFPAELNLRHIETAQGPRVTAVARDVTERMEAEERLRVTAERLNEAQEVASIGSWELDLRSNELWWSDQTHRIFGLDSTEFGASYEEFLERVHPDDRDMVREVYTDSVETRIPYAIDHRLLFPDGRIRWVHERCETIYAADGTPLRSVGTAQDITEQKMLELERKAIHRRYQDLLEHAADAILLVDADGVIHFANGRVQDAFGYAPHELVGQRIEVLVPAAHRDAHVKHREGFSEHPTRRPMGEGLDLYAQRKDGSRVAVDVSLNPMESSEGRMVMATVRDISDRKAAEEAEKARVELQHLREIDNRLRDFINAAAHDLKQPLTPMQYALYNLELMLGELDEAPRRSLRIVQRNLERMNLLVQDLLDVARLESGTLEYTLAPVDLDRAMDETRAFFEAAAAKQDVELHVEDGGFQVQADRRRILQVLFNLVGNALKFTPAGGSVTISVQPAGEHVRVEVQDTGPGLRADQMERLFQPFVQVHDAGPGAPKGTGLGLYISKGIIEQHGGRIGVQSDGHDTGSTFWFTLPLAQ